MKAVLIEDNLMFAMMIEPVLRRLDYEVRTVSTAAAGLAAISADRPDLVLVNLGSTRFSGGEVVTSIRAHPEFGALPVVGYAGHVERHLFQAGREAGADLVVPNSAIRAALPEVLEKLRRRLGGASDEEDWPDL
jgi:CheY-like chemotaxis protein